MEKNTFFIQWIILIRGIGVSTMEPLKWLWKYIRKYRISIVLFSILSPIFIGMAFLNPLIVGWFVDDVLYNGNGDRLVGYAVAILLVVVLKELIEYARRMLLEYISQGAVKSIRNTLYNKLQELDSYFYDRTKTGELMSRLTMDTDAIRVLLSATSQSIINLVFYIVIGFIVLFSINPTLTVVLFSVAPFILYFGYKLSKESKPKFIKTREANAQLNTVVRENIDANRVVKAYAREEYEIEKFEEKNKLYASTFMERIIVWTKYAPPMQFFVRFINVLFMLVGGISVARGVMTVGQFATFNGSLWCITTPMNLVVDVINQYQQFVASSIKIIALEEEDAIIKNGNIKKRDTGVSGKIQFKNVNLTLGDTRIIKNMNFTVEPGQTLAIIGPTGSGKSMIINLLSRFYDPTTGTVYIDDINLKNIDIATIRRNVSSAMQDVFLFSDTILNNIAYGEPNVTFDDVVRVAKMADAHSFIETLEDGYDTIIGERGMGLSGGQRQRISLARALLKNPAILILDDTTSALDMETEYQIQENLKETHKTKIIIAHRISSVKNADLILVLNQGSIIEWGTHEKLLSLNGYYKSVFEHQFGDFNKFKSYHIKHPATMGLMEKKSNSQVNKGGKLNG